MTRFLCLLLFAFAASVGAKEAKRFACAGSQARFRLSFEGAWSEEAFPKQYPKFRPPAQFSRLVGRSHDGSYRLWASGTASDGAFRDFVQEGSTEELDREETQGFNGILDAFTTIPLESGVGEVAVDFFADFNHTKLSTAVKLIPSPDWFVGVDSAELCKGGHWRSAFTVPLQPMDAGTDQGFTFTSPNWASKPAEKIFMIEAGFPSHRASSFHYPEKSSLPPLGFLRVELSSVWGDGSRVRTQEHRREAPTTAAEGDAEQAAAEAREALEEKLILAGEPIAAQSHPSGPFLSRQKKNHEKAQKDGSREQVLRHVVKPAAAQPRRPPPPKRKDCLVSGWETWAPCSKTCGFGVQRRTRDVAQEPRHGRPCPPLAQEKWCGSMRSCTESRQLFSWVNKPTRRVHRRRRVHHRQ